MLLLAGCASSARPHISEYDVKQLSVQKSVEVALITGGVPLGPFEFKMVYDPHICKAIRIEETGQFNVFAYHGEGSIVIKGLRNDKIVERGRYPIARITFEEVGHNETLLAASPIAIYDHKLKAIPGVRIELSPDRLDFRK